MILSCNAFYGNERLNRFEMISYAKCEHFWSYGGKLVLLSKHLLSAAARSPDVVNTELSNKIKSAVMHIKLLSIVSVPFSLVNLKSIVQNTFKSLLINDKEGAAMGALSFTATASDAFDSATTFVNALVTVIAKDSIAILSAMGLPLSFVMSGIGTVSRTIKIAKAFNLYKDIHSEFFSGVEQRNKAVFKNSLEEKLRIDEEEKLIALISSETMNQTILEKVEKLKERKKAIILRSIPGDAIKAFERICELLNIESDKLLTDQEVQEIFKGFENIRNHLQKKIKVDVIGILANLIVISALVLFSIGMATALPFLLMALGFMIRLLALIYQDSKCS